MCTGTCGAGGGRRGRRRVAARVAAAGERQRDEEGDRDGASHPPIAARPDLGNEQTLHREQVVVRGRGMAVGAAVVHSYLAELDDRAVAVLDHAGRRPRSRTWPRCRSRRSPCWPWRTQSTGTGKGMSTIVAGVGAAAGGHVVELVRQPHARVDLQLARVVAAAARVRGAAGCPAPAQRTSVSPTRDLHVGVIRRARRADDDVVPHEAAEVGRRRRSAVRRPDRQVARRLRRVSCTTGTRAAARACGPATCTAGTRARAARAAASRPSAAGSPSARDRPHLEVRVGRDLVLAVGLVDPLLVREHARLVGEVGRVRVRGLRVREDRARVDGQSSSP